MKDTIPDYTYVRVDTKKSLVFFGIAMVIVVVLYLVDMNTGFLASFGSYLASSTGLQ